MVEFCSEPDGVEGLSEKSIERWRIVRASFTTDEEARKQYLFEVPEQYHLHIRHFDNLPGHGPLSLPSALQPPPSSDQADIKTDIHESTTLESSSQRMSTG